MISSYSASRSPDTLTSQSANRAWSPARVAFGMAWYAASRISRCLNRYTSSPAKSERSGRRSSLRVRASSCTDSSLRSVSAPSSDTAPRWKTLPSTAPRSRTARSGDGRPSSLAARRALIVGGTVS